MKRKYGIAVVALILVCVLGVAFLPQSMAYAQAVITHDPLTSAAYGSDLTVTADITGASEATLYYNTFGKGASYRAVPMTAQGSTFSATLSGVTVVPEIYYYIEAAGVQEGSADQPHKIKVTPKDGYQKPVVAITEMNAVNGRRYDFVEMQNLSDTPIELSKLSLVMHEYICNGTDIVADESNYKGEAFFATDAGEGVKQRVTADHEVTIAPGEHFVMFIGKTASSATEQTGLGAAPFNFEYLQGQYTASKVGAFGVNASDITALANTKMFLAVSDPYGPDLAVIPDPAAKYAEDSYGTMWTVKYDGAEVTRAVIGMNNDGTYAPADKSTNSAFSDKDGVSSVHYSPYMTDIVMNGQTITVQSRSTGSKETAITFGFEKALPSVTQQTLAIDLASEQEQKTVAVSELITVDGGNYFADEYTVTYAYNKQGEGETPAQDGNIVLNGIGQYQLHATFESEYFGTFRKTVEFDAIADTQPPVLENLSVTEGVKFGGTMEFSVKITDNIGISETEPPKLYYKTASNAAYTGVLLQAQADNVFTAAIDTVTTPYVYYYIEAKDALANVGSIGSAEDPEIYEIGADGNDMAGRLVITEANAIRSKRADFLEVYNNSNKPIALSQLVIKRYDYIVTNGSFSDAFRNREANAETGLAVSIDNNTAQKPISADNEVYIQPGETFVVFTGDIYGLAAAPLYFDYVRSYYNADKFPGVDLGKLTDNVNAFLVNTAVDGSPTYSASKYGTAYALEYDGVETCVAVVGMDNEGNFIDEASTGSDAKGVGSTQYGKWTVDVEKDGVTQTVQGRISDNKQAVISFNTLVDGQKPDAQYIVRPEVTLKENRVTVYGSTGTYDLQALLQIRANGYQQDEYTITANDGADIPDLTQYAYTEGTKTITFTVSSVKSEFEAYELELVFTVVNSPVIEVAEDLDKLFDGTPVDVSEFFTVREGSFAGKYTMSVTSSTLPIMDGKMLVAGVYEITVRVTPINPGDFEPISETFTVRLQEQPTVTSKGNTSIGVCDSFDVSTLFTINNGGFDDAIITYEVCLGDQTIALDGTEMAGKEGVYTVTVTVAPKTADAFRTVSETVTLTIAKEQPTVSPADDADTLVFVADGLTIRPSDLFDIQMKGYTADELDIVYTVTKDGAEVALTDGVFAASKGVYTVTVRVSGKDGAFEPIVSTVTVTVADKPAIGPNDGADLTPSQGSEINLNDYLTTNLQGLPEGSYKIEYRVTCNGNAVAADNGVFVADQAGEYAVCVSVVSTDGSFTTVTYEFVITVGGGSNVGLIVGLVVAAVVVVAAAVVAVVVIRKKKSTSI